MIPVFKPDCFLMRAFLKASSYIFVFSVVNTSIALAQTAPAGSRITNQALIRYVDKDGVSRETTTNEVVLDVQQVYVSSLRGDNTLQAVSAQQVLFFHTLENQGNGEDRYCISLEQTSGDQGDFKDLQVFSDRNHNGLVDGADTLLYTEASPPSPAGFLTLKAGQAADLLVRGEVPSGAAGGARFNSLLRVQSQQGGEPVSSNLSKIQGRMPMVRTLQTRTVLRSHKRQFF